MGKTWCGFVLIHHTGCLSSNPNCKLRCKYHDNRGWVSYLNISLTNWSPGSNLTICIEVNLTLSESSIYACRLRTSIHPLNGICKITSQLFVPINWCLVEIPPHRLMQGIRVYNSTIQCQPIASLVYWRFFLFHFHDLNIYLFVLGYLSQMAYFLTLETYCQTDWSTFLKLVTDILDCQICSYSKNLKSFFHTFLNTPT